MAKILREGDVIELKEGHTVYDKGLRASGEVALPKDFAGEYVVYKTAFNGGGTGHGRFDVYPNGHHVYCEKLYEPHMGIRVDFYQTGSFTAMIKDIEPVGFARLEWVPQGGKADD